jgi:transcriptional regulator with XRE-family HTH domain
MANRVRSLADARRNAARLLSDVADELRTARRLLGLRQRDVADAIGSSTSEVSRRELGTSRQLTPEQLSIHAAAVGLRLWMRLFPVGGGIRDAAQVRYVAAFVARLGRSFRVTLEAPIPVAGDLRAVDILLVADALRIAVEVITRVADLQAQIRAAQLKARDIGAGRLIIVVADTHANVRALAESRPMLANTFDLDTRRVMSELEAGRDPGRDAFILMRLRTSATGAAA